MFEKEDIKRNITIQQVLQKYLICKIGKNGNNLLYELCPFCSHKWHFQVNIKTQLYNSFNQCINGGDVITLAMNLESLSFNEAINFLGNSYNITKTQPITHKNFREIEFLRNLERFEEKRINKKINIFFDYLKFKKYEAFMFKALTLLNDKQRLINYIYNLEAMGLYSNFKHSLSSDN